jgi:hypothetical protein
MDNRDIAGGPDEIRQTLQRIAIGSGFLLLVMFLVYLLLGRLTAAVVLGGILGVAAAMLNLFLLGQAVRKAASTSDADIAKGLVKTSYSLRMLMQVLVCVAAFLIPGIDGISCLIALVFPRIVIFFLQVFLNKQSTDNMGGNNS